jgi:hypothetical protein
MSKQVQIRRGTTAENAAFTGAVGEITYDTELKCLRLHDGVTAGGKVLNPLLRSLADTEAVQDVASGVHITGGGGDENGLEVDHESLFNGDLSCIAEAFFYRLTRVVGVLAYAASVTIDFTQRAAQTVTLAGNVTFVTSNLGQGRSVYLRVIGDTSLRTLTFPVSWIWIDGTAPASLAANKQGVLELFSWSTDDSNVQARWRVQS